MKRFLPLLMLTGLILCQNNFPPSDFSLLTPENGDTVYINYLTKTIAYYFNGKKVLTQMEILSNICLLYTSPSPRD